MVEAVPSIKIAQVCLWGNQITGRKMFFLLEKLTCEAGFYLSSSLTSEDGNNSKSHRFYLAVWSRHF